MKKIMVLIAVYLLTAVMFIGFITNETEASEIYDYSNLTGYDYNMGNEYNNMTKFASTAFDFNATFEVFFAPVSALDVPIPSTRIINGDYVRIANYYYKFIFDDADNIILFKGADIHNIRTINSVLYGDKVEIPLSQSLPYSIYRYPTTFYFNDTLYLFVTEFSTGNILRFNVSLDGTTHPGQMCFEVLETFDKMYVSDIIYKNDTFKMFVLAFQDAPGFINDKQEAYILNSLNLSCWQLDLNFTIDESYLGYVDGRINSINYYEDTNKSYIYLSYGTRGIPQISELSSMNHIIYDIHNNINDTINYTAIHYENSTNAFSYTYTPIGDNIIRNHWDFTASVYYTWHKRGNNTVCADYNAHYKMYYIGIIESNNMCNCTVNMYDYISLSDTNLNMPNFKESFTLANYYFQLNFLDIDFSNTEENTIFDMNLYLEDFSPVADRINFMIIYKEDYVYTYQSENIYTFYRSNNNYFKIGTTVSRAFDVTYRQVSALVLTQISLYPSINVEVVQAPDATGDFLFEFFFGSSIMDKLGWLATLAGVASTVGALALRDVRLGYIAFVLIAGGIFMLTGLGIFGIVASIA